MSASARSPTAALRAGQPLGIGEWAVCNGQPDAKWLGFERPAGIAALMALLGWLTDHFSVTYSQPDPYPYSPRRAPQGTETCRLPV
jgi:hypothetical protein